MNITFKNDCTSKKAIVSINNQKYIINPGETADVFCESEKNEFFAQSAAFDELIDATNEIDDDVKKASFKDKILLKLTKKFVEKIPEIVLNTSVKYELTCTDSQNAVVNLSDGIYSVCDGKIADFLDLIPVGYVFSRAEAEYGKIKILDVTATNRKSFLKLMRNTLLFMHSGLFFVELFLFLPEYLIIKFFSSHFYMKRLFVGFYNKSEADREQVFAEKERIYEQEDKKGCLSAIIKVLIVLLVLGGICFWSLTSEPDVIISQDFQTVECFDEIFVKIDSGLPEDAEKVFLEDYTAYYPLADDEYDMDNYYCYIYEDSAGVRYMWLKDSCSKEENADKDYNEYENPLVYKSIGEDE